MKHKLCIFMPMIFCIATGCGGKDDGSVDIDGAGTSVEYSYKERYETIEEVMANADSIVKATLVETEDFNGYVNEYYYTVEEDYIGNAEKNIYVYDGRNGDYIEGHTYFLFLSKDDTALYPNPIYTSIAKDCILDLEDTVVETEVMGTPQTIYMNEVEESILELAGTRAAYADRMNESALEIMESGDISEISEAADIIAEIAVSKEAKGNKYVSAYEVEVIDVLKGNRDGIATHLLLPPDLKGDSTYYVFFKENAGEYLLFVREHSVVETTAETTDALVLD